MARRGVEGIFSEVVDDDGELEADDEDGLTKLPGAITKETKIIQANKLARMLCERGILSMLSAMFMYRV